MKIAIDGKIKLLLKSTDLCPICDWPLKDHVHTWQMAHGETETDCGAVWQIKDFYVETPPPDQELLLILLGDGSGGSHYYEFRIKLAWIKPLRIAMERLKVARITIAVIRETEIIIKGGS